MKNKKLNTLIEKANKINDDIKANSAHGELTPVNPQIRFRDFKLYYALLNNRKDGWGALDFIGVVVFPLLAWVAFLGRNESTLFTVFKIVSIGGAVFFITKEFFVQPMLHCARYPFFKNWIGNSGINVAGWEKIYNKDEILIDTNWYQHCSVLVALDSNCPPITKTLIDAASVIFIDNTKWVQNNSDGNLNAWELKDGRLAGSANNAVLGYIQRLILNDLNTINKAYGGIASVEINADENTIHIRDKERYTSGM